MTSKFSILFNKWMDKIESRIPHTYHPMFNHPAGPKTIFFWAPLTKWGLVIAGLAELKRPAEKLSMYQAGSLMITCCIWSRYSLVIIPKNYSLLSVNFFIACSQGYQFCRAFRYWLNSTPDVDDDDDHDDD